MNSNPKVLGSLNGKAPKTSGLTEKAKEKAAKKPQVFDPGLFAAGVGGYLRSMTPPQIPFEGEYSEHPAFKEAVELFEISIEKSVHSYDNAVLALADFKNWLDGSGWTYVEPELYGLQSLTVSVSMNTPSGTLSVSMQAVPYDTDTAKVIRRMKDDLQKQIRLAFPGAAALPPSKEPTRGKAKDQTAEYKTEQVRIKTLRVKLYQDKVYFNAIPNGGRWVKYGIPVYKDVLEKFNIDMTEDAETGDYDVDWLVVYELNAEGKPRRVIDIEQVENEDMPL